MQTHYENCKDCGLEIASWGGGMNWQKHEEWVCQGKVEEDVSKENVFVYPDGHHSSVHVMDGGAGTMVATPEGATKVMTQMTSCCVKDKTTYCRSCAEKHSHKCPECGGEIKLERKTRPGCA